ncbi:MAG: TonB-dependent receptor [Pseudomonadota bacterium]
MSYPSNRPNRSIWLGAACAAALTVAAPVAYAQGTAQRPVTIPAGSIALSNAYGIDVSARDGLIAGKQAAAVDGNLTPQQALRQLLAGTGLEAQEMAAGTFVVAQRARLFSQESGQSTDAINAEEIVIVGKFQDSLIDRLPITVQELPFTLNTVSREDIDQRNFIRRIDILDTLPNVQIGADFGGLGNPQFSVRGFIAPVLVNNRVLNAFRGPGYRDDSFIERYEVLKGPASIALGPIAGGGVINTVTKQPGAENFTDLRFTTDQFGTINAEFDFNDAQLFGSENVGFRVSGAYRDFSFEFEDGFRQEFAIRPVVQVDLERTSARLSFAFKDTDASPNNEFFLNDDGSIPEQFDQSVFFGFRNGFNRAQDIFVEGQVVHDFLDNLKLTVRGSYQDSDNDYQDRTGVQFFYGGPLRVSIEDEIESTNLFLDAQLLYTTELGGLEQSIVVGVSYNEADILQSPSFNDPVILFVPSLDDVATPAFTNPGTFLDTPSRIDTTDNRLASVYAEFAVRPIEKLSLIGGIRYDNVDQNFERLDVFTSETDRGDVTFRLGASYEITSNINAFVSFAEAFVPQVGVLADGGEVGPENSKNYEIGVKGTFLDGLLNFNLSAFSTTRFNVAVADPNNTATTAFFVAPIGKQRNQGIELSTRLQTEFGLLVDLNYGYLDQKLLENLEGGQPRFVPDHQVSVFGSYEVQSGPLERLNIGGGFRYFSTRPVVGTDIEFPSVTVGDAVVSYPIVENTTLSLNVLNITDSLYLENGSGGSLAFGQNFGTPRTFVFSFRTRF